MLQADKVRADDLAERMAQPGIETMIRTHAMVKSCQERIRELQAEQRGPHFMDRNYVVLPPLADAPPEAVRAGSVHSEAPVSAQCGNQSESNYMSCAGGFGHYNIAKTGRIVINAVIQFALLHSSLLLSRPWIVQASSVAFMFRDQPC